MFAGTKFALGKARIALIIFGVRKVPSLARLLMSFSQFAFSKPLHPELHILCLLLLFNLINPKVKNKKEIYLTVTDFARFLGVSGLMPFSTAI